MERVIALLKEKNTFLEKFYMVNENELINLGAGDFDNVEPFYQARDKILELIRAIETLIEEENKKPIGSVSKDQRIQAEELLKAKDELVAQILAQDLQLIEYIEKEKSNIIRELRANQKARRAVGAYANSERLHQLDEK